MSTPNPLGNPSTYVPAATGPAGNIYTSVGQTIIKSRGGTIYGCLVTVTDGAANSAVVQVLDGTVVVEQIVCPTGETRGFMLSTGISHYTSIIINIVTLPAGAQLFVDIFFI